ncbi:hypothetical protein H0E87_009880 [Populus deltoides]|uniref:PITH domain-containing protein n=1 Tax=Populus deltoides TaxID=3696 RepID=A0A8T2YR08_POPDE|nr:hypothetical protein H0E87_009880 [Populus deltoides]
MSAESATAIPRGQVDLLDFIDFSGVECLNQSTSHSLSNAIKQGYREDDGLNLESDADEQLLIHIPFNQVIKLHSIAIKGPEEDGPKMVKLFSNKEHMGFSNVNDYPPSDTVVLSPDTLKVDIIFSCCYYDVDVLDKEVSTEKYVDIISYFTIMFHLPFCRENLWC